MSSFWQMSCLPFFGGYCQTSKGGEKASHNVGYVLLKLSIDFFFSILTLRFSSSPQY
jgi:hypothetical protein